MNLLSLLLLVASLAILILGAWTLRISNNHAVVLNTMFASGALLYAAYQASARSQPEWVIMLPFFATMLLAGRALGTWWRSRREDGLRETARLMLGAATVSLAALVSAWLGM